MQSRTNTQRQYETTTLGFWDNYTQGWETIFLNNLRQNWSEVFDVIVGGNIPGDRKNPNPNEFARDVNLWYSGSYSAYTPKSTFVDRGGPVGISVSVGDLNAYPSNLYNEALSRLFDKIRGQADISVDLFQAGQTKQMLSSAAKLVKQVHSFRPSDLASWWKTYQKERSASQRRGGIMSPLLSEGRALHPKSIGSKWLEFQYGWKPTAQTLYDTAIELARAAPAYMKVEGIAHSYSRTSVTKPWGFDPQVNETVTTEAKDRVRIRCQYDYPSSALNLLSNFTSLNPANIIWELTPYSFVVDWFLDVGGYLRNLETAMLTGAYFRGGYITEGYRRDHTGVAAGSYTSGNTVVIMTYGGSKVQTGKRRSVLNGNPYPRAPSFKADLGSGRLLNAAALLSQHLGRK